MDLILSSTFIIFLGYRIYVFLKLINRRPDFYSDEVAHSTILKLSYEKKKLESFFLVKSLNYPVFYHKIIRLIFKHFSFPKVRNLSVLASVLFIVINFFFFFIFSDIKVDFLFLVSLYFISSLSFFGFLGITFYSFSERPFADLILYCFLLSMYTTEILNLNLNYLIIILMVLIIFSSKFGLQLIFFFSIFSAVLFQEFNCMLCLIISIIMSFLINKKRFVNILIGHYCHLKWYLKNYKWLEEKPKLGKSSIINIYKKLSSNVIFGKLLLYTPFFPLYLYILIDIWDIGGKLFFPLFILSLITIVGKFKSLGPSYRYSYLAVPIILLIYLTQNPNHFPIILFCLFFEGLASIFIFHIRYIKSNLKTEDVGKEIETLLKNVDLNHKNILTSPVRIALSINNYLDFNNTKFYGFLSLNKTLLELHNKYLDKFPFMTTKKDNLQELISDLKIDTFIIDKELVKSKFGTIDVYKNIKSFKRVLFESERLIVLELNSKSF